MIDKLIFAVSLVSFFPGYFPSSKENNGTVEFRADSSLTILISKKDIINENVYKTFRIVKNDMFNGYTSITYLPGNPRQYDLTLFATCIFSVFYNNNPSPEQFLANPGDTVHINLFRDTLMIENTKKEILTPRQYYSETRHFFEADNRKFDSLKNQVFAKKSMGFRGAYFYSRKNGVDHYSYVNLRTRFIDVLKQLQLLEEHVADSLVGVKRISAEFATSVKMKGRCWKILILNTLTRSYEGITTVEDFNEFGFFDDSSVFAAEGMYRDILATVVITNLILQGHGVKLADDFYTYDYRHAFDSSDHYLSGHNLEYVKFCCLLKIKELFGSTDFNHYVKKFFDEVRYEPMRNYVQKNILIDVKNNQLSEANSLVNNKDSVLLLSSLLGKGRVVYMDFWASWCLPCKEALPASFTLRRKYNGKNIDFIYISIDELKPQWLGASISEGLSNYPLNFLLYNPKRADVIISNKISSIPRYLLFDKRGKLIYSNAPGPSGTNLKHILDSLLNKSI